MQGFMLVYHPYNSKADVTRLDAPPTLEMLQKGVGGYIEQVPGFDIISYAGEPQECVAFCEEEGKLRGLEVNNIATVLWDRALRHGGKHPGLLLNSGTPSDILVGDIVVIIGDKELLESL